MFRVLAILSLVLAAVAAVPGAIGSQSTRTIVLRGTDSQNVRPFTVSSDSDVIWKCPQCRGSNFIISSNQDFPVNALGPGAGKSFIEKGRFTGVHVTASGSWVVTIKPTRPRPVRKRYVLKGIDSQNLKPLTLTHDSDLVWSCAACKGSNFIVSSDQDYPVNALGPTKGKSFLEKGRYTGVSVTASGAWVIILR